MMMINQDAWNQYIDFIESHKCEHGDVHHIKPRSIFPDLVSDPSNIVVLSPYDHLLAHKLLVTLEVFGLGTEEHRKMASAFMYMCCHNYRSYHPTDEDKKLSRELFGIAQTGTVNPACNPVTREHMSENHADFNGINNPMYGRCRKGENVGWHHTEETKRRMSAHWDKDKHWTPESRKHLSDSVSGSGNPNYGKRWMNNGTNRKMVPCSEVDHYLSLGYTFGQLRR